MAELKLIGKGFEFDKVLKNMSRDKKQMPLILGNIAKNHFLEGFRKGGGQTDASRGGWKERKTDPGRAILVKSGKLRRDIKVRKATFNKIVIGTGGITKDYAEAQNEGTKMTVTEKQKGYFIAQYNKAKGDKKKFWANMIGAQTITIPQREYIGNSTVLNRKLKKRIIKEVNQSWIRK